MEEDWRQDLLGGLGFPGLVSRKHRDDTYLTGIDCGGKGA